MSSRSFQKESKNLIFLEAAIKKHIHELVFKLKEKGLITRSIKVYILPSRHGHFSFQGAVGEIKLNQGTDNLFQLQETALKLLRKIYSKNIPYKKAGVEFSNLIPNQIENLLLFNDNLTINHKTNILSEMVHGINKKFGHAKLQLGLAATFEAEEVNVLRSQSYTTKWSDIKSVLAK